MSLNFRRLNNYNLEADYDNIVKFLSTGKIPDSFSDSQKTVFTRKYQNLEIKQNKLFYGTVQVVKKDDIEKVLLPLYNDPAEGFGHGITQFYNIVANKYLNITRKDVTKFLKGQTNYQLTFKPRKRKQSVKKYDKAHEAYALDLIDIHRYSTVNKNYNFILTMIDVFSQHVWLRKLKNKNAETIHDALRPIFATSKPRIILMDNGTEFKGINTDMFKEFGIKTAFTMSHSPQANIEQANGRIRSMLSKLFVKNRNTIWISHLSDVEKNINNYNALPKNVKKREKKVQKRKDAPQEEMKPLYKEGDIVRISQHAVDPDVRKEIKAGQQKYIHVKYTVALFEIIKVHKSYKANSLAYYSLRNYDENDDSAIKNAKNNATRRFKENDLLLLAEVNGEDMTEAQSKKLNGTTRQNN